MAARLDHLVFGTPDLDATSAHLAGSWGIGLAPGGSHAGMGTRNQLLSFGDGSYFELIGPDPDQDTAPSIFQLASLQEPRLLTFAARVDDISSAIAALRRAGHDPGEPIAMERRTPNGDLLSWTLTPPTSLPFGGTLPFLIDWGATPHPSASIHPEIALDSFEVRHPAPHVLTALYRAIGLDIPVGDGPIALLAQVTTPAGRFVLQ